ncbi:MAG TPA: hypothetical protein P5107_11245 [Thermotogota bacterium]|nr:hypothetical protein [Thermotogota bacterium]
MGEQENKNQVTMESHERWYRMLRVKLRNWHYKFSYRELEDFTNKDRLNFEAYENRMTLSLLKQFSATERYFLIDVIELEKHYPYQKPGRKTEFVNYHYICHDDGKLMIPRLCFRFKKRLTDTAIEHEMETPDITDKNIFLAHVLSVLDKFLS